MEQLRGEDFVIDFDLVPPQVLLLFLFFLIIFAIFIYDFQFSNGHKF